MKRLMVLALVVTLSACSSLKFWDDGSSKKSDSDGDIAKAAELQSFEAQVELVKLWREGIGKGQKSHEASLTPGLSGDTIYAASRDGKVAALNKTSGDKLWRADLDTLLTGGVGVGGGLAVVGNNDGEVIALDADTGVERWRVSVSSEILAPPGVNSSIVVVQTQDAKLVGLSASTGDTLWRYETDAPVLSLRGTAAPLVTDTMVISGFANGKLVALESSSGSVLWEARMSIPKGRTELERMIDVSTPVIHNDIIYVTSYQGRVVAFSRGSGRELWGEKNSSYVSPGYGLSQVYVVDETDTVQALRSSSGKALWTNDKLTLRNLVAPKVVAGLVAVADAEGYLHLLSQTDGTFAARIKVAGDGVSVPMESDGDVLYVLDNNGDLTAYTVKEK